ncbi:phage tail terminator-like protein, partial [Azotobacter chroococcum]|nr:phage tail terminator-like protein [Azotobacter chroococcum]
MSNRLIRSLYEQRLAAWAAARSLPVAWQNVPFTPPASGIYLRAFLLPADTDSLDLEGAHRLYTGVFQISIVAPNGNGSGDAEQPAADLDAEFPQNLRLTSGAFAVQIVSPT